MPLAFSRRLMPDARLTAELRRRVTERASGCCEYCWSQARYATHAFSVEHIVARARGGTTVLDNLALACQGGNNHKYDKTEAPDPTSGQRCAPPLPRWYSIGHVSRVDH